MIVRQIISGDFAEDLNPGVHALQDEESNLYLLLVEDEKSIMFELSERNGYFLVPVVDHWDSRARPRLFRRVSVTVLDKPILATPLPGDEDEYSECDSSSTDPVIATLPQVYASAPMFSGESEYLAILSKALKLLEKEKNERLVKER